MPDVAGRHQQRHMAAPEGTLVSGSSSVAIGSMAMPAPQPTVPVAFRSRMQAGLPGCTVLIAALSWPTLERLAALHAPAEHVALGHFVRCGSSLPAQQRRPSVDNVKQHLLAMS